MAHEVGSLEQAAHDAILALCRSEKGRRLFGSQTGMRTPPGSDRKRVVSLTDTRPKPGSSWEREDIVFAEGASWVECEAQLRAKGLWVTL